MSKESSQSEQLVLDLLASEDPDEIRIGAFKARELGVHSAMELLVAHIESSNLGVQEAAEIAIRHLGGPKAVALVAPLLRSEDASIRNSAMDILREIGGQDLKVLTALLHDDDPDIRIFSADILGSCSSPLAVSVLSEALKTDPEVNVRYQICISLGALGYVVAAQVLSEALEDEEWVQFAAIEALAKIRADSCAEILIKAMQTSSELVASTIANALGEMGNLRAVPMLLQILDTSSGPLRNQAVKAIVQILGAPSLGLFGPKDLEKFRAYLIVALEDEDEDIVQAALTGLMGVGLGYSDATTAVLELISRLDAMREHDLLLSAIKCLTSIGYTHSLHLGLISQNEKKMHAAAEACGNIGDEASITLLKENMACLDRDTQRLAIHAMSRICTEADVPYFMELLEDAEDAHIIKDIMHFLGRKQRSILAAPILLRFLMHPFDDVKEEALEACLALQDPEVNAQLTNMFDSEDPLLRLMAVYSMGEISAVDYLELLIEALHDELPDIRKIALEALGNLCSEKPELVELFSPLLQDESQEVRMALISSLGHIATPEAVYMILQSLDDHDNWVRIRAIEALGRNKVKSALPKFVEMLDTHDVLIMLKIIEALGQLGGKIAFRTLLGLASHADLDVQRAVAEALANIRQDQGEEI